MVGVSGQMRAQKNAHDFYFCYNSTARGCSRPSSIHTGLLHRCFCSAAHRSTRQLAHCGLPLCLSAKQQTAKQPSAQNGQSNERNLTPTPFAIRQRIDFSDLTVDKRPRNINSIGAKQPSASRDAGGDEQLQRVIRADDMAQNPINVVTGKNNGLRTTGDRSQRPFDWGQDAASMRGIDNTFEDSRAKLCGLRRDESIEIFHWYESPSNRSKITARGAK